MKVDLRTVKQQSLWHKAQNSLLSQRKIELLMKKNKRSEMKRRDSLIIRERLRKKRFRLQLKKLRRRKKKKKIGNYKKLKLLRKRLKKKG